jgi:hypothetical protein
MPLNNSVKPVKPVKPINNKDMDKDKDNNDNIIMLPCHLIDYHPIHTFMPISVHLYDENGDLKRYRGYKCVECNPKVDIFFENNFIVSSSIYTTVRDLLTINSKDEMKEKYKQHILIKNVDSKVSDFVNKLDDLYDEIKKPSSYSMPNDYPLPEDIDYPLPEDIQEKYDKFYELDNILQKTSKKFDEIYNHNKICKQQKPVLDVIPELISDDSEDDSEDEDEDEKYKRNKPFLDDIQELISDDDNSDDYSEKNTDKTQRSGLAPIKFYESNLLLCSLQWENILKFDSKYRNVLRELNDLFYGSYVHYQ